MQALEFTRALKEIKDALRVEELLALLERWIIFGQNAQITDPEKDQFTTLILSSNVGYERLKGREATRKIIENLAVGQFYESARLRAMITVISNVTQTNQIYGTVGHYVDFYSFAEQLRSFRTMESASRHLLAEEKIGHIDPSEGIVELELIEYADEVGISPKRLEIFIASVKDLHTSLMLMEGIQSDTLTFKYFDSGSGLLAGIKCAREISQAIFFVVTEWWNKIRFARFETFHQRADAIGKTLTVAGQLHAAVQNGVLTEEEGKNLKMRILQDVNRLTEIGATIPLGDEATVDQRQFLTEMRNTKLLTDGAAEPSGQAPGNEVIS
jgi:hypothetical protein